MEYLRINMRCCLLYNRSSKIATVYCDFFFFFCNLLFAQSASSDSSLQSFFPSHLCFSEIQTPFPHANCPSLQAAKTERGRETWHILISYKDTITIQENCLKISSYHNSFHQFCLHNHQYHHISRTLACTDHSYSWSCQGYSLQG